MKLSEQLKQDHESGDFGKALEGYSERALELEEKIVDLRMQIIDLKASLRTCANSASQILEQYNER